MNNAIPLVAFVFGFVMTMLGIAGLAYVHRRKVRRRGMLFLNLDELSGRGPRGDGHLENRIEIASRFLTAFGLLAAIVGYVKT